VRMVVVTGYLQRDGRTVGDGAGGPGSCALWRGSMMTLSSEFVK